MSVLYTKEQVDTAVRRSLTHLADTPDATLAKLGAAQLGEDGKLLPGQLPPMDYDPAGSAQAVQEVLTAHVGDKNNPHGVTAAQVGAVSQDILTAHTGDKNNPHGVTAAQVGAEPVGAAQGVRNELNAHVANRQNPHGVTAAQIGLGDVDNTRDRFKHVQFAEKAREASEALFASQANRANTAGSADEAIKAYDADLLGGIPAINYLTEGSGAVVVGKYTGDGTLSRKFNLGFYPRAVFVLKDGTALKSESHSMTYGGLAVRGGHARADNAVVLGISNNGFAVMNNNSSTFANMSSYTYYYVAFR